MNFFEMVQVLADKIEMLANLILIVAAWKWIRLQQRVTITLSIGSFRVKRKHCDLPTLTAITSQTFFKGGWLPDNIRHELLMITTPEIRELHIFESSPAAPQPQQEKKEG